MTMPPRQPLSEQAILSARSKNRRLRTLSMMNRYISRTTAADVCELAEAVPTVPGMSTSFYRALAMVPQLPETEARRLTAGFTVSQAVVELLLTRLNASHGIYEALGADKISDARLALMGASIATQVRCIVGEAYGYMPQDQTNLMAPWVKTMPVLPDGSTL